MSLHPAIVNARLGEQDIHLFREGTHGRLYRRFGCTAAGGDARFVVWAPNAQAVSVIGDFNGWQRDAAPAKARSDDSGIWELELAGVQPGRAYKFAIRTRARAMARQGRSVRAPRRMPAGDRLGGARVCALRLARRAVDGAARREDRARRADRGLRGASGLVAPRRDGAMLGYREAAARLVDYVQRMGFTHVELLPVTEHPFYGSWGYQTTGYFAPTAATARRRTSVLVDMLHQAGIGVILDWVPSHFPADAHGLAHFDGTHLYEHADPRQGFHPEWNSSIFNYGRNEVRAFLLSSALFWLDEYPHRRRCASTPWPRCCTSTTRARRASGSPTASAAARTWRRSSFLRMLNEAVYRDHPGVQTIAEESTAWPMVSRPTYLGGLGFGLKWNMGWMHDTLDYMHEDPVYRRYHHEQLTFSLVYAFSENFVLPLSHDEVVHGKGSLIGKMPGDDWQQFANLRLLLRLHVGPPGQEAAVHGRRVRPVARVDARRRARLGTARRPGPRRHRSAGSQDLNRLLRAEPGAARARLRRRRLRVGRLQRRREQRAELAAQVARRPAAAGGVQLHAGAARRTTWSGVPRPGHWRERLTATPRSTAAAASATWAASTRCRCPRMAASMR